MVHTYPCQKLAVRLLGITSPSRSASSLGRAETIHMAVPAPDEPETAGKEKICIVRVHMSSLTTDFMFTLTLLSMPVFAPVLLNLLTVCCRPLVLMMNFIMTA